MLVNTIELLKEAKRSKCAIPAINVFNLAGIKGAIAAAEASNCPLIVSLAEVHIEAMEIEEIAYIFRYYAERVPQKIALHFDHGLTPAYIKRAIDAGFTSVMIDGSSLGYEENVKVCREIVAYAHMKNVSVEGEIGHVGEGESYLDPEKDDSQLTTVEDAVSFALETGLDSLAVSIGTAHGAYAGVPELDFNRLHNIAANVSIPLVLHGGSGSGDENLNKCVRTGIVKVNIFTDTKVAAKKRIESVGGDYYKDYFSAIEGIKSCVLHYYKVFETAKGNF